MKACLKVKGRKNGAINGIKEVRCRSMCEDMNSCSPKGKEYDERPTPARCSTEHAPVPVLTRGTGSYPWMHTPFLSLCRAFSPRASALKPFHLLSGDLNKQGLGWAAQLYLPSMLRPHLCISLTLLISTKELRYSRETREVFWGRWLFFFCLTARRGHHRWLRLRHILWTLLEFWWME